MRKINICMASDEKFVSIVILNYNDTEHIQKCIASVFKTIGCTFEVILIDNGSSDKSSNVCKQEYPEIRLFENEKNLAMAARNIGIDNAKGNFIVFLDSDATVDPNWLHHLILRYHNNGEGLYQGKILKQNDPETIINSGSLINIFGFGYANNNGIKNTINDDKFRSISFTSGACSFSSLETIKKIGYFDESNLLYLTYDDVDYGWKALSLGIHSFYEPKSIIYHPDGTGSKLNSKKIFLIERNRWICLLSYYTPKTILKLFPLFFLLEFGIFFFLLTKGNGKAKIKSFFSIITMYNSIKKRRIILNKNKKLSDQEMVKSFVDTIEISGNLNSSSFFQNIIIKLSKIARNLI